MYKEEQHTLTQALTSSIHLQRLHFFENVNARNHSFWQALQCFENVSAGDHAYKNIIAFK